MYINSKNEEISGNYDFFNHPIYSIEKIDNSNICFEMDSFIYENENISISTMENRFYSEMDLS